MWKEKNLAYPWLRLTLEGGLICDYCIKAGGAASEKSGSYSRSEWTKKGIVCSGQTKPAQLQSLRTKISSHKSSDGHKSASRIIEQASKNVLPEALGKQTDKFAQSTSKLITAAYSLAKHNRPYVAYGELCDLLEATGVNIGVGLHSRFSATAMIDCIAGEMRKRICDQIISSALKISIMMDESTTVSRKSCLILYVRTSWPGKVSSECFAFPVGLIELESMTANHITEAAIKTLNSVGFDNSYLSANLIGACSDGASVMLGKNSGVLTQLKNKYPSIFLWHCMCHRIELAIGDAVKSITQVNHVKSMLDKLYSVYSYSPKAQRELEQCASAVGSQLRKIGRVLGVRWVASSFQSLEAVWISYAALHSHSYESDSSQSAKHKATYAGIRTTLESKEFVHSLAVMLDALKEVSTLSKTLQSESCTLTKAYQLLKRTVRVLMTQKEGTGAYYQQYLQAIESGYFKGVRLASKGRQLDQKAFIQALVDNLSSRLDNNVSNSEDFTSLLGEFDIVDSKKWPTDIETPWLVGESRLRSLCERFGLAFGDYLESFRDFIDNPEFTPAAITKLQSILNSLPVSSADCERGFSTMNVICTDLRNALTVSHTSNLMFISLVGPPLSKFCPKSYVKLWLRSHRSAEDTRTRVAKPSFDKRYANAWDFLK